MRTHPIKILFAIAVSLGFSGALIGQESINVYLSPSSESALIGKLDSRSLAVTAEWPENAEPTPSWQPIYYRGDFLVYLDSADLGKNHLPAPGSRYLLAPNPNATTLAIATDEDKAEILEIDPRYCLIKLETIVLGYIEDPAAIAPPPLPTRVAPAPSPATPQAKPSFEPGDNSTKTIEGIIVSSNSFEFKRTGIRFKLINDNNRTIAFVDPKNLPEYLVFTDYINARVIASGPLTEGKNDTDLILSVRNLKKKN